MKFYARNKQLALLIPYEFQRVSCSYEPDFLVRLKDGRTLILEIKGFEEEEDRAKHEAARRWVSTANNWGRVGPVIVLRLPRPAGAEEGVEVPGREAQLERVINSDRSWQPAVSLGRGATHAGGLSAVRNTLCII
ncbi:MAG: hypothetical protein HY320_04985 [Armatimonadetes bacterium]|nr:hypothetical protein [Armatimonadota bacterium]